MTGLDKMISQILEEAQSLAKEKEAKAAQEADAIRAEAEQETKKQTEAIMKKAEQGVKDYQARLKSADEQKRRTALLAAKQEIIRRGRSSLPIRSSAPWSRESILRPSGR